MVYHAIYQRNTTANDALPYAAAVLSSLCERQFSLQHRHVSPNVPDRMVLFNLKAPMSRFPNSSMVSNPFSTSQSTLTGSTTYRQAIPLVPICSGI